MESLLVLLKKAGGSMIVTFKNAVPMDDYTLQITMSNGNKLKFNMEPYLGTVQFCPLKDSEVWKNIKIHDTYLLWEGSTSVELSIDTLLAYFKLVRDIL
ncbi:MAG: hypothetical protein K0R09_622 [Clostridiales bacterium]|nr:hypothetical protein [Clostridiales bacterium]